MPPNDLQTYELASIRIDLYATRKSFGKMISIRLLADAGREEDCYAVS